jgi:hypothetical protein
MLVKHLFSSLWGTLVSFNKMNITYDEIQEKGLNVGMGSDCDYTIKEYHQYENQENHKKCTKNLSNELEYLNSLHKDQKSIVSQINKNVDILNNMN